VRVLLTGVSCVGKTTIGAELAQLLKVPFFDLDIEVEKFFETSISRLQARCRTMTRYRGQACRVLELLLSRSEALGFVIALPPRGLMVPYLRVVRNCLAKVVVVEDDPINILDRIQFYDIDSNPIAEQLDADERRNYLDEIKAELAYFKRSYSKANMRVHIRGSRPREAAQMIKLALEAS